MKKALVAILLVASLVLGAFAYGETSIETITEWVEGGLGIDEQITEVTLVDRVLTIDVDLSNVDELYPGYITDLATERASSITDNILDSTDFDAEWDSINIGFSDIGYFVFTKDDIETNEYDMRYMNVYDEEYNSRIIAY